MLYLALSCLQGRPAGQACRDLKSLGIRGIQLTPGNVPDAELAVQLAGLQVRSHHGFCWNALRRRVWDDDGVCRVPAESVHPPTDKEPAFAVWWDALARAARPIIYETMYPGYRLGSGAEIERAMHAGLSLAVDVSHIHIQRCSGAMSSGTWERLQRYAGIAEIHVSDNAGRIDSHRPLSADTFGLGWARERAQAGVPMVLECYMHKLSQAERHAQVALLEA